MTSTDLYNSMHIDISVQDNKHYGLKCVELVKQFLKDYEALEPLIFALKNILKNANLNDPYTVIMNIYFSGWAKFLRSHTDGGLVFTKPARKAKISQSLRW